jgi:predicted alpha/beta hydrolase family esterase
MAATVLFIQGAGAGAHDVDRSVAADLQRALGGGFRVSYPRMPSEEDPKPSRWKSAIAAEARASQAAMVVAHSAGATMVADILAEGTAARDLPQVRAVFLLAPPYVGQGGWDLGEFHLDARRGGAQAQEPATFFYFGASDSVVPPSHADLYRQAFPDATFRQLGDCDHQFTGRLPLVVQDMRAAAVSSGLLK